MLKKLFCVFFIVILISCKTSKEVKLWNESVESGNLNGQINYLINEINKNDLKFNSIVVVKNGNKIFEEYKYPYNDSSLYNIYSGTKSIMALLIGIAIDKGSIKNEHVPVLHFFPEYSHLNDMWDEVTIEHLLTMTSGIKSDDESYTNPNAPSMIGMMLSDNWVDYIFTKTELKSKPGDIFTYSNLSSHLLAEVLFRATEQTPLSYLEENVLKPLDISEYDWLYPSPEGVHLGASELLLRTEDWAKIGHLVLNKGSWNGKSIVSSSWINQISKDHVFSKDIEADSYGYLWWQNNDGSFYARGYMSQYLFVFPESETVVAINGSEFAQNGHPHYYFVDLVRSLFGEPKDENILINDYPQMLDESLKEWRKEDNLTISTYKHNFDDTYYILNSNLYFNRIKIKSMDDKISMKLTLIQGGNLEFDIIPDGKYRYFDYMENNTAASRFYFVDESKLVWDCYRITDGMLETIEFSFNNSKIDITFKSNTFTDEYPVLYSNGFRSN